MDIRFGDHASFHRAAAGMVVGSATLGLALHAITPLAPLVGGLFGLAVGSSWAYGKAQWRLAAAFGASLALLLMGGKLAAGSTAATAPMAAPILAGIAAVMGLGLAAFGLRGARGLVAVLLGSFTTLLALWAALKITGGVGGHGARELVHVPSWARDVMASAAMGMIGVFSALPRHLKVSTDPIKTAVRQLPAELDTEVHDLCHHALAIWENAKDKLADNDPGKNLVRDGVLKTLEVATKSADVKLSVGSDQQLAKRMEDLDQRITNATDTEVKTQYQAARAALDDQRRYRDHIKQNRERLIARMHNHVAALEKFQLAAGGLAAVRAASAGAEAVKQLEELSADVAASGEALAELEIGAPVSDVTSSTTSETSAPAEA